MLFRLEEIHLASRMRPVLAPTPGRETHMADDCWWSYGKHAAVPHANVDGLATVEAGAIDADLPSRKQPTDG